MTNCLRVLLGLLLCTLTPSQDAGVKPGESRPADAAASRRAHAAAPAGTALRQSGRSFAYGARRPPAGKDRGEVREASGARATSRPAGTPEKPSGRSFK